MFQRGFQKTLALLVLSALINCAGCEKPTGLVPVSGQVWVDGEPLTSGTIRFFPASGRPVSSAILEDGSFQLAEVRVGQKMVDGISPGEYRIAVSASEIVSEDPAEVIWRAPAKYADFRTSGLETKITGPVDDLKIDLTWEGSEPADAGGESAEAAEQPLDEAGDARPEETEADEAAGGAAETDSDEASTADPATEDQAAAPAPEAAAAQDSEAPSK